ncbi:hypothetical protein DFH09DRAFT_1079081 [Mycena vulgaris]|nr:hypothetical protein DFH09DRAFT_1079081 [Mycena vulgaris]
MHMETSEDGGWLGLHGAEQRAGVNRAAPPARSWDWDPVRSWDWYRRLRVRRKKGEGSCEEEGRRHIDAVDIFEAGGSRVVGVSACGLGRGMGYCRERGGSLEWRMENGMEGRWRRLKA